MSSAIPRRQRQGARELVTRKNDGSFVANAGNCTLNHRPVPVK